MKFDMHCHTKEGSMDGKVMIEEYIRTLKRKGFGGMLVYIIISIPQTIPFVGGIANQISNLILR